MEGNNKGRAMAAGTSGRDSFLMLYEKLQVPHPLVQRHAVVAIFERLKISYAHHPSFALVHEVITQCFSSSSPSVIDQTAKEVCKLAKEGIVSVEIALQELQAALDSVGGENLGFLVNGIGFLCRIVADEAAEAGDMHRWKVLLSANPLVKALRSREGAYFEILHQLGIITLHAYVNLSRLQMAMEFLRSFSSPILLQPVLSCSQVLFARQVHHRLSVLGCAYPEVGLQLLKMLTEYTANHPIQSVQELDMKAETARDLVDLLENLLRSTLVKEEAVKYGYDLLFFLVGLFYQMKAYSLPSSPALLLFRRVQKLLQSSATEMPKSCNVLLASLAHMLAATEAEQEQLIMIDLVVAWIMAYTSRGNLLKAEGAQTFHVVFLFVFPALQLMSLPSPQLRSAAVGLLRIVEDVFLKCSTSVSFCNERVPCAAIAMREEIQMAEVVHYLFCSLWSQEAFDTWLTLYSLSGKLSEISHDIRRAPWWLKNVGVELSAIKDSNSMSKWDVKSEGNKGYLLWTTIIASALLLHPSTEISIAAIEILASISRAKPICGLSLFPVMLFVLKQKMKGKYRGDGTSMLSLLKGLPLLANHGMTLPLIVPVVEPMLEYTQDVMMQATGMRLMCEIWECSDRAFPYMEKALQPSALCSETINLHLAVSRAASLRDMCRNNPDRGTDLVLSVQACIESKISFFQALGLECLSYLCEHDTIDFYSAWWVVSKLFSAVPTDPLTAKSLCMLLGHGSWDAEQHPEDSRSILEILWQLTSYETCGDQRFDWKVRVAALKAFQEYKVDFIEKVYPLSGKHVQLFLSETSPNVKTAWEDIVVEYMFHEHRCRVRGQEEKKHSLNRLEKLLGELPEIMFPNSQRFSSPERTTAASSGAGLLFLDIPSHTVAMKTPASQKKVIQAKKEACAKTFFEVSDQLSLKQSTVTLLLALESWCSYLPQWLKAEMAFLEQQASSIDTDTICIKAGENIMKILFEAIEDAIPRRAINAILALAALCKALPLSAHIISKSVAEFLISRASVHENEYIQWSSAISVGMVSACLHATDWMLRSEIINLLLNCAAESKSGAIRAGCGVALGLICHNLLKGGFNMDISDISDGIKQQEISLLLNIVRTLLQLLLKIFPSKEKTLNSILECESLLDAELGMKVKEIAIQNRLEHEAEEDLLAAVGLVIGLGISVPAVARSGKHLLVLEITKALVSWIPEKAELLSSINILSSENHLCNISSISLAVGSCIALPICLHLCCTLELIKGAEIESLLNRLSALQDIWEPLSYIHKIWTWTVQLSAAAAIATGNLLAFLVSDGSHPVELAVVKNIIHTFHEGAKASQASFSQLGAMVGLANALGAGAVLGPPLRSWSLKDKAGIFSEVETRGGLFVCEPLCLSGHCEGILQSVVEDIIGIAQNGQDLQGRSNASWALGLFYKSHLRIHGAQQDTRNVNDLALLDQPQNSSFKISEEYGMRSLESLPAASTSRLLCSWLVRACSQGVTSRHQTILSVLRCLEMAPRLPALDWSGLVRRLMRCDKLPVESSNNISGFNMLNILKEQLSVRQQLRRQCVSFCFAHAARIPSLAAVLDELYCLSRLGTIELPLLLYLIENVALLQKIFSLNRFEELLKDLSNFLYSAQSGNQHDVVSKQELRISMWKGLYKLLKIFETERGALKANENFGFHNLHLLMELLIGNLPSSNLHGAMELQKKHELHHEEWKVTTDCLSHMSIRWLLRSLEVQPLEECGFPRFCTAVVARARLVRLGCMHSSSLKIVCTWLANQRPTEIWTLVLEVSMALGQSTMEEKQEWIINIIDTVMACKHPLSAMLLLACVSSIWSSAAPFLVIDHRIMETLPLCLPLVLKEISWQNSLNVIFDKMRSLTEFFGQNVARKIHDRENMDTQAVDINTFTDRSLYEIGQRTCVALREHL